MATEAGKRREGGVAGGDEDGRGGSWVAGVPTLAPRPRGAAQVLTDWWVLPRCHRGDGAYLHPAPP